MTCFFYSSEVDRGLYDVISRVTGYGYDVSPVRESATGFTWKATNEGLLSDPVLKPLVLRAALLLIVGINPFDDGNQVYSADQPDKSQISFNPQLRSPATITVRPETLVAFGKKSLTETEVKKFLSLNDLVSCLLLNKLETEVKTIALQVMQKLDTSLLSGTGRNPVLAVTNPENTFFSENSDTSLKGTSLPLYSIQPNTKAENIRLAYLAVKSLGSFAQSTWFADCVCPLLTLKNCPKDLHKEITEVAVHQYLNGEATVERYELEAIKVAAPRLFKQSVEKFIAPTGMGRSSQSRINFPLMSPKEKLAQWSAMPHRSSAFSHYSVIKDREVQNYLLAIKDAS